MKNTGIPKLVYGSTLTGRRKGGPSRKDEGTNTVKTAQYCNGLYPVAAGIAVAPVVYYYYYYYSYYYSYYYYYYYYYGYISTFAVKLQKNVRPTATYNSPYHVWEMRYT
jgi:hypothetical protein